MKTCVFIIVGLFVLNVSAQAAKLVEITDSTFKDFLVKNYDSDGDGEISTCEAEHVTRTMDCSYKGITTLKGIEAFTNLTELKCQGNHLRQLDLSSNKKLKLLRCYSNYLTALTLPQGDALSEVDCHSNMITSLNVTGCIWLATLLCQNNRLTLLDLTHNKALVKIDCSNNRLSFLNIWYTNYGTDGCYLLVGKQTKDGSTAATITVRGNSKQGTYFSSKDKTNELNARVVFEASATGIHAITLDRDEKSVMYTLDGRRIANPQQGIFIEQVGGVARKKVVK